MAKAKGKEKPTASTVPAEVEDATGDNVTAESSPSEPVKMEEETTVDAGADSAGEADEPEEAEKVDDTEIEEEVKEDGTDEAVMVTDTPGDKKEEAKTDGNVENASNKKGKRQRKRKTKEANAGAAASNTADKPETSDPEKKGLKKADGMGLIFMCNSETKKDCFRHKVFGLPESKKDLVAKIYKGMRLFLYNIDDKMLYGIYKATSPGGYNLEPKAFKSGFPSQVRFTVLDECNPLPIEKFRVAIKANFFGKSKFNVQLSREQVKDLCKLFTSETKGVTKQKRVGGGAGTSKAPVSGGRDRRPPRPLRNAPFYPRGPTYPRESYPPQFAQRAALPPPLPHPHPFPAYERQADDYYYRREPPLNPYSIYRESAPYPVYPPSGLSYAPPPPHYRY